MNQASVDKFADRIKPGGTLAYNETLVESVPRREDIRRVPIPANRIAMEMEAPQVANMIATGGLIGILGRISVSALTKGLARVLPQYRHDLIPLNEVAIGKGADLVAAAGGVHG